MSFTAIVVFLVYSFVELLICIFEISCMVPESVRRENLKTFDDVINSYYGSVETGNDAERRRLVQGGGAGGTGNV